MESLLAQESQQSTEPPTWYSQVDVTNCRVRRKHSSTKSARQMINTIHFNEANCFNQLWSDELSHELCKIIQAIGNHWTINYAIVFTLFVVRTRFKLKIVYRSKWILSGKTFWPRILKDLVSIIFSLKILLILDPNGLNLTAKNSDISAESHPSHQSPKRTWLQRSIEQDNVFSQ